MANDVALGTEVSADCRELCQKVYEAALALYRENPNWVKFFREVLGLGGIVRRHFPTQEALQAFEKTPTYAEIQGMLCQLRQRADDTASREDFGVITVRLPKSLHDALRAEAYDRRTSMNKLCISKLLQIIDEEFVPSKLRAEAEEPPQAEAQSDAEGQKNPEADL